MADPFAEEMSKAGADVGVESPKKGDTFRCRQCGVGIEVTAACKCKEGGHAHFHCCGQEPEKV
jgi:hypothetical protein